MGHLFPFCCWGKGFKILEGVAVESHKRGSNDTAKINQSLVVNLVLGQQFHVVAEIAQEPVELPQGSWGAIETTGERPARQRFRLKYYKPNEQKGFLAVPAIGGPFDTSKKQTFERNIAAKF